MIKDLEMGRFFWIIWVGLIQSWGFPGGSVVKNLLAKTGDLGLIPGSGRFPGGGNDNSLQCSCLENPTNRGAWYVRVAKIQGVAEIQGVAKIQGFLKDRPKRSLSQVTK